MIELTALREAINVALSAGMPELKTVEAFSAPQPGVALPAVFHALTGMQPGVDPGDGRCGVLATFKAVLVVQGEGSQASLEAATLAARLTVLLRKQFWGLAFVEGASNVQASAIDPVPMVSPSTAWRVQWEQLMYLGDPQWPWPDEPPGSIVYGFSPDTGTGHAADYRSAEDMA